MTGQIKSYKRERRFAAIAARLCLICLMLLTAACARLSAVDKPLKKWMPEQQERTDQKLEGDRSSEYAVLLAFSGGGARASSFAYGALKELANTQLTTSKGSRSLLTEVDMISSVSGGSFTAAYYGLHGEQVFTDFEPLFLRKNIEHILLRQLFNPINWFRLISGTYGRADLAASYYDKHLFHGATFADLQRPGAPRVIINATDIATGIRFPFNQSAFDLLCADRSVYPLSRAVAASSAVPIVFSPITLENFAGSCGYQPPAWLAEAEKDTEATVRKIAARRLQDYLDVKKRPWLHLMDGGISDNLGLRSYYDTMNIIADPDAQVEVLDQEEMRHILIISVNARARHKDGWVLERVAPSLLEIIGSVSADEIARYSDDTIELVRSTFRQWTEDKTGEGSPRTFHFVDVSFDQVGDDSERKFLNSIGTNFDLSDDQVDRLIAAAGKVLRESSEFQAFIKLSQDTESR
ncbi:MAG: patatin-like phospholipase family protein [Gammaproteobacteria bacterium]|nr:MAG: patatin-like phospholipase family protein [Gammaproteobacteria bacterium]RLA50258.1 MAG: patatin-like phospholipase family protein [Gammaproteobacteria bacterium]